MSEHYLTIEMKTLNCKKCSLPFCVPKTALRNKQRLGAKVSCPNGHRHSLSLNAGEVVLELVRPTPRRAKVKIA